MKKQKKLVSKTLWELQFGTKDNGEFYTYTKKYDIERIGATINGQKIYAQTK